MKKNKTIDEIAGINRKVEMPINEKIKPE